MEVKVWAIVVSKDQKILLKGSPLAPRRPTAKGKPAVKQVFEVSLPELSLQSNADLALDIKRWLTESFTDEEPNLIKCVGILPESWELPHKVFPLTYIFNVPKAYTLTSGLKGRYEWVPLKLLKHTKLEASTRQKLKNWLQLQQEKVNK